MFWPLLLWRIFPGLRDGDDMLRFVHLSLRVVCVIDDNRVACFVRQCSSLGSLTKKYIDDELCASMAMSAGKGGWVSMSACVARRERGSKETMESAGSILVGAAFCP